MIVVTKLIELFVIISCFMNFSCSSNYQVEVIGDPAEYSDDSFQISGFKHMATYMSNSIVESKILDSVTVAFLHIYNNTTMHFNTKQLADLIVESLIERKNITVVERDELKIKQIINEWKMWESGFISETHSRKIGELLGTDYFIYGIISSEKQSELAQDSDTFLLTLKITSTETGQIKWSDHISIRSTRGRNAWEYFK